MRAPLFLPSPEWPKRTFGRSAQPGNTGVVTGDMSEVDGSPEGECGAQGADGGVECPITEARDHLADLVNRAAYAGETIYLTRRGRRLAAIVPVSDGERLASSSSSLPARHQGTGTARADA